MTTDRKNEEPWVSAYDSELKLWVSWDEMQKDWYRERQARCNYKNWNHPMLWAMQSNGLHLAALCLWSESKKLLDEKFQANERRKVALMLAGMSLECAIKSRMIALCEFPINRTDQRA